MISGQIKVFAETKLPAGFLVAYTFDCASGPTIVTRIAAPDAIDLILPDEVRRLHREPSAFGVKYSNQDVSLWNKGREATLYIRERRYLCVEERAGSIREDALLRGVQFRATGEEADWVLELLKDQISFTDSVYGSAVVPRPLPEEAEGRTILREHHRSAPPAGDNQPT